MQHASQNDSRPAKMLRRDQSPAKRHLPRLFRGESNIVFIGSRNKKGKYVLLSRPKVTSTRELSKASTKPNVQNHSHVSPLRKDFPSNGDASSTYTSVSNTDTSVTSIDSEVNPEQDSKPPASGEAPILTSPSNCDEESIVSKQGTEKPLIYKMGPQDVNVLQKNEYLIELCQKYKSSCKNKHELAEKIIDWVHGKGGNFVVPCKGVFTVAPFSTVNDFLQRIFESATQPKPRAAMTLPKKLTTVEGKSKVSNPLRGSLEIDTISKNKSSLIPTAKDVICGRGNACALHPGNM